MVLIVCFLITFSQPVFSQSPKDRNYEYQKLKAVVACNEGDYQKSIKIYNQLIKKGYTHADLFEGRALCYRRTGEYEKAIADFRHLIKRDPLNLTYYQDIAAIEHLKNNPEGELEILTEAIRKTNSPELLQKRGDFYKKQHNPHKALKDFSDAFEAVKTQHLPLNRKYDVLTKLCDDYLEMHMPDTARMILDYAADELKFDRSISETENKAVFEHFANNLNECKIRQLIEADRYDEAIDLCEGLINQSTNGDKTSKNTGYFYGAVARMHLKDYDGALKYFARSKTLSPRNRKIPYYEGECYYQQDNFTMASVKYEEWSETKKDCPTAEAYEVLAEYRNGKKQDILSALDSMINQNPGLPEILFVKARALGVQGKEKEAFEALASSLRAGFSERDRILFGLSDLEPAVRAFRCDTLLAQVNIHIATKGAKTVAGAGLIHSPPYAGSEKRLALVIGNGMYENGGILANPENDEDDMAAVLAHLGFDVMAYKNADQTTMKRAIDEFGQRLKHYDVGLFFYAGHGIQAKGINYLIPVDASIHDETDVEFTCVDAGRILSRMEEARNRINIIILDACRDNPFERSWNRSARGRGLAKMDAPKGSIIAYATEPGNTASDGSGRNGLYTGALLDEMQTPGIIIEKVFRQVRTRVLELSGEQQTPWESTSLTGDFYFLK